MTLEVTPSDVIASALQGQRSSSELARLLGVIQRDAGKGIQLRQAIVLAWSMTASTVDVQLGDVTVPGVRYLESYLPFVGDTVWCVKNGPDVLVIGAQDLNTRYDRKRFMDNVRSPAITRGGGVRTHSTTGVSWSKRFIAIGAGRTSLNPDGFFDITMPPDGTVINRYVSSGAASVTVAGGVVPMIAWETLYYDLPIGQARPTQYDRYRLVGYSPNTFEIPWNWVPVVSRTGDNPSGGDYSWVDGQLGYFGVDGPQRTEVGVAPYGAVAANSFVNVNVTFTRAFTSPPVVGATVYGSTRINPGVLPGSVTNTGCTIQCNNSTAASAAAGNFTWTATGV